MATPDPYDTLLQERQHLTQRLFERPYSCITYLQRATCHDKLGYPDLAAGDAYRALLLADEISDDSFEYHEEALQSYYDDVAQTDPGEGSWVKVVRNDNHAGSQGTGSDAGEASVSLIEDHDAVIEGIVQRIQLKCFACLSDYLCQCGCLKSAYDFAERGLQLDTGNPIFLDLRCKAIRTFNKVLLEKDPDRTEWDSDPRAELPNQGYARRELYPWNKHEPDRFSEESLQFLNREMEKVAPKCEVRAASLPVLETSSTSPKLSFRPPATIQQLGVFAKEDIGPHE
ncbi:MAG: hypothetical protein Q9204_008648, partial [Flavoplaca sp. TL-2023a]